MDKLSFASWYCHEWFKSTVDKTIHELSLIYTCKKYIFGENVINHTALLHSTTWKPGGIWGWDRDIIEIVHHQQPLDR